MIELEIIFQGVYLRPLLVKYCILHTIVLPELIIYHHSKNTDRTHGLVLFKIHICIVINRTIQT